MNKYQNGAALVLTLGVLALITVLAVSFATLMRVEEKTARIAVDLNKGRYIAFAGLNHAIAVLKHNLDTDLEANALYDSSNEEWVTTFSGAAVDLDGIGAEESKWIYIHENPADDDSPVIGRYAVLIQDEAGKINLNVAGVDEDEGWSPLEIKLSEIPGIGSTLDNNIVNYREGLNTVPGVDTSAPIPSGFELGDDNDDNLPFENDGINNNAVSGTDENDEGIDSPIEFDPEIPYGDDRAFASVEELINVSGIGVNIVNGSKNYATVWSYDINQYWNGANWSRKVNLNHLLSTGQLYNLIEASNVYRIAANMIDYADRDFYPTLSTSNAGSPDPTNTYIGLEGLQINEVTNIAKVLRENDQLDVTRSGWSTPGSPEDIGNESEVGTWSWPLPWSNNENFTVHIYARTDAATPFSYTIEGVSGSIGANPTVLTILEITGPNLDLELTAPNDPTPGNQQSYFDKIEILGGKFVELTNISQRDITVPKTVTNSWKINFGGTINFPLADGLPATVTGGSSISLSTAWNDMGDVTITSHTPGSSTFHYLIITDSLYSLDTIHGDNSGVWGDGTEQGTLIAINRTMYDNLSDAGTPIAIVDSNDRLVAYAPSSTDYNVTGYFDVSVSTNESLSRTSPANQTSTWPISATPTPGANNSSITVNAVKDRPYATIGELGDVLLGTSNNGTYDVEADGSNYFDKITVAAKRLEAEDANSPLPWTSDEDATDHDGTKRRIAPNATDSWNWNWTFDISNIAHLTKPFRLRNNTNFDALIYGQFIYNFESPLGTLRYVKPNHGVGLTGPFTVTTNNISIPISGNGVIEPKLDFIVLTPEPYTWGKININTASEEALKGLPGINTLADDIIAYRASNIFDQIQEVTAVSGIGEAIFKKISNLITVRSDVYRVLVRAERLVDLNGDGNEGDTSDQTVSTVNLEAVVDRNPDLRFPGTADHYRIEYQKYNYEE